jgi:hypothetical protein
MTPQAWLAYAHLLDILKTAVFLARGYENY